MKVKEMAVLEAAENRLIGMYLARRVIGEFEPGDSKDKLFRRVLSLIIDDTGKLFQALRWVEGEEPDRAAKLLSNVRKVEGSQAGSKLCPFTDEGCAQETCALWDSDHCALREI